MLKRFFTNLTLSISLAILLAAGVTFAAYTWDTSWIQDDAVIDATYIRDNFDYLYDQISSGTGSLWSQNISSVYYNTGNVGIGTASPAQKLHTTGNIRADGRHLYLGSAQDIYGDNSSAIYYDSNHSTVSQLIMRDAQDTQYGRIYGGGDGVYFGLLDGDAQWSYLAAKDNYTQFRINNSAKMTIQGSGNVGIGTTDPSNKLEVAGKIEADEYCDRNGANCTTAASLGGVADNLGNHTATKNLTMNTHAIVSSAGTIRDANGGWVRTYGNTGWYNGSHGGGWYMGDSSWIRSYGNKSIYHNSGILRTDGTLQVGPSGNRFIINSAGSVGIGTTGPKHKFHVNGGNMFLSNSATGGNPSLFIGDDPNGTIGTYGYIGWNSGSDILTLAAHASVPAVHINESGNVGIGTASISNRLEVAGNVGATAFLYNSDERLKKNIKPLANTLGSVLALKPSVFTWKGDGKEDAGLIAQDVEEVIPDVVHTNTDGFKTVDYAKLTTYLIGAMQEQQEQINALTAQCTSKNSP